MSTPDPRIETIFHEALNRAPAEREALVAEASDGDESLQQEVQRLLAAHEEAENYFEPPNTPEIEAELARLKPEEGGEMIGPYKLLEQIGEGGFGTVWVAEQKMPVRRRVALKILKLGMDTKEVLARFEQERQALALMDHPSIARVFDAGATQYGRPFIVMELVAGVKITEYCDGRNLPMRERLELFMAVCQAVQHAHQKGVIHRDLKPSNILVTLQDGLPAPKVIDFGVAKAVQQRLSDLTIHTRIEQMIGTPPYMSPEQAEASALNVDTRTDIYALGVLLYELLTGRTPFDAAALMEASYEEMRRIIREEEPPKPSTALHTMAPNVLTEVAQHRQSEPPKLIHTVRGDLDWIVMKALEKDRDRRYVTANGFALDVQRHLQSEPVVARPPSRTYRFQKLVRRNKLAAVAAASIALVLGLGGFISIWQRVEADRFRDRAEKDSLQAELRRAEELLASDLAGPLVGTENGLEEAYRAYSAAIDSPKTSESRRARLLLGRSSLLRHMNRLEEAAADKLRASVEAERSKTSSVAAPKSEFISKPGVLRLNEWHHLAATFDGHGTRLYLDGALVGSAPYSGGLARIGGSDRHFIGACTLHPNNSFHGQIREARLWRGVRTSVQIRDNILNGLTGSEPELVGLWNFDDPANPGRDASRNAHHAKLIGQAPVVADADASVVSASNEKGVLTLGGKGNYLELPADAFQGLNEATFECWVKWHSFADDEHVFEFDAAKRVRVTNEADSADLEMQVIPRDGPDKMAKPISSEDSGKTLEQMKQRSEAAPGDSMQSLKLASLQLWHGKVADYIATCRRALREAADTTDIYVARRTAKMACLRQTDEAVMREAALTLAQRGVELANKFDMPWFQMTLGMAEYRIGNFTAAAAALAAAEEGASNWHEEGGHRLRVESTARFYRAMSLFKQGDGTAARELFTTTKARMTPLPDDNEPLVHGFNHDELILWLTYKEAKALLQAEASDASAKRP